MPFAASITTFRGLISDTSTNDNTRSTYAGQTSYWRRVPGEPVPDLILGRGPVAHVQQARVAADGQRALRTIFIPVYSFGLCDAVTMIPPSSPSSPTAK